MTSFAYTKSVGKMGHTILEMAIHATDQEAETTLDCGHQVPIHKGEVLADCYDRIKKHYADVHPGEAGPTEY